MLSFSSGSFQSPPITSAGAVTIKSSSKKNGVSRTASLIVPRLYLSDFHTAGDTKVLTKLGITHVLTVMEQVPTWPEEADAMITGRMQVAIADRPEVDILKRLDETTQFIKGALESNADNKVLVHCFQGVSRSATVVSAYLVAMLGMEPSKAISFVKSKRGIVAPNVGFVRQLQVYGTRYEAVRIRTPEGLGPKVSRIVSKMRRKPAAGKVKKVALEVKDSDVDSLKVETMVNKVHLDMDHHPARVQEGNGIGVSAEGEASALKGS